MNTSVHHRGVLALALLLLGAGPACAEEVPLLAWKELPSLPDPAGLAGTFAGVSNGALLVAGGANFPDKPPWEGGAKVYHDAIYVLPAPDGSWTKVKRKLPRPLAYGVSITHDDRVICIGGEDNGRAYREVFALRWADGDVEITDLPPLPSPCVHACGALLGSVIYVAGGLDRRGQVPTVLHTFWALDLAAPGEEQRWQELPPWPGPERHLAVAGVQDGSFFLFGGVCLEKDGPGEPRRITPYLDDAYRYTPSPTGGPGDWRRVADLPAPVAAAPSPALPLGQSHLVILGGVDGSLLNHNPRDHPGFPRRIHVYHTITDTWVRHGEMPEGTSRVTAPTTPWQGGWVIPSGETSPGRRSPRVFLVTPAPRPSAFGPLDWTVLALYFAALLGMGFFFARREHTTDDFFLAGRRVPWWAAGLSIYGTQLSAITFMAIPAVTYATDWVRLWAAPTILLVAPVVIAFYLPFFRRLEVSTAYEYLEKRFNLPVRLLGSAAFILFQAGRMGVVVFLPALALAAVTGMNVYLCILIMGVVSAVYTVLGGIEAVIWTDVLQVIVLVGGAILCLTVIVARTGGWGTVIDVAAADDKFGLWAWGGSPTEMVVWVIVVGNFFFNLAPYTTDQTVVQRYLTTPDEKQAARGIWTNGLLAIPTGLLFCGLGTALYVFYKAHPQSLAPGMNDEILPWFVVAELPAGLAGLVVAAIFAAAMSSLDSSMNSIATALVTDFYRRFRRGQSEAHWLRVARWLTVLAGAIGTGSALLMATLDIRSLFDHFISLMGLIGGGLSGVFALAVFTRRTHAAGALLGMLAGAIAPLVAKFATPLNFFLYPAVGFGACVVVGYLTSRILPGPTSPEPGLTVWDRGALNREPAPVTE